MKKNFYSIFIEPSLIYGGILGAVYVLVAIFLSILDANFSVFKQWFDFLLPLGGLFFCLYMYRKEYLNNNMTYGRAFGMGLAIMLIVGIVAAAYNYIYSSYINPDIFKQAQVIMEEKLLNKQIDPSQIEFMIEKTAWTRTPINSSLITIGNFLLLGCIFSLIVSAFVKKENVDPFKDVI